MKKATLFIIALELMLSMQAQPLTKGEKREPLKIQLHADEESPGCLLGAVEGTADDKGDVMLFGGQDMFQPLLISVVAAEKEKPLKVSLHKDSWDEPEMGGTTSGEDGYCEFKIRSAGEVGVKITASGNADYYVLAYAGKEIAPSLKSPFIKKANDRNKEFKTDIKQQHNTVSYIVGSMAGLLIVLAGIYFFKKKRKTIMPLLILIVSCASLFAQTEVPGNTVAEISSRAQDKIKERNKNAGETFGKAGEKGEKAAKILKSGEELWDAYKNLGSCMSVAVPDGMPSVPSFCEQEDGAGVGTDGHCAQCFMEARKEFSEVRYKFIKLGVIYGCTKSFADKSMAFGDDVSSIHAVQGLAWQAEKRKIEESVDRLKKSYDDKYIELLQRLHDAMMKLNDCEAQFGESDWYDRYGFVFYEFMKEKYRRPAG